MKITKKLIMAGMIAGFILMAAIGYFTTYKLNALADVPAPEQNIVPAASDGLLPCPGNCAGCNLCTAAIAIEAPPETIDTVIFSGVK